MDLNKQINFNLNLKNIDLKTAKGPLGILFVSVLVFFYCINDVMTRFSNQDLLMNTQAQINNLSQQKTDLASQYNQLLKDNKAILKYISNSPKTKSEMTAVLTKLVSLYRIKLIKLAMNENSSQLDPNAASQAGELNATADSSLVIDLEGIGSFANIILFTTKLKEVLAASEIESFKLAKLAEGKGLQLNLIVKFSPPPNDLAVPETVTQDLIFDDGFSLAFKKDPWMRTVGFVEIEKNLDQIDNTVDGDIVPPAPATEVFKDPFAEPSDIPSLRSGAKGGNVDADGQPIAEPIYYLSGILYSDEYRMCTVNLPSGETKIFTEKDKINEKITILSIQENSIKICGACKGNFKEIKIGEELAL